MPCLMSCSSAGQGREVGPRPSAYDDYRAVASRSLQTPAADVFSFGLVLLQLSLGGRHAWWPATVDDSDITSITFALQRPRTFAEWAHVDPTWPLADIINRCLTPDATSRPTAAELVGALLAAGPRCFAERGGDSASLAIVEQRNRWLLHDSRHARADYIAPFCTHRRDITRVPEDLKGDAGLLPVTVRLEAFLSSAAERVLVLLGDGGAGKSLTLQQMVAAADAQKCLLIQLRPALPRWSHAALHGAVSAALRWYGVSSTEGIQAHIVIVLDAYDELEAEAGVAPAEDLPAVLGMAPNMKLVLCARRSAVPETAMARRFGPPSESVVQYLLPLTTAQIEALMRQRGLPDAEVAKAQGLQAVVETPFLLRLYCECWSEVATLAARHWRAGTVQRRHVYEAALSRWVRDAQQRGGLLPKVEQMVVGSQGSPHNAFVQAAQRIAHAMFAASATDRFSHPHEPWSRLFQLTRDALRAKARSPALVDFRVRELRSYLAGCPLRVEDVDGGAVSFAHKSFRDFLAAAHYAAHPADTGSTLLTMDAAVQRFVAEFVDCTDTAASLCEPEAPKQAEAPVAAGRRMVAVLRSASDPVAVANAITALNTAGVPLSGLKLAGLRAGGPPPAAGVPFADLGGAMLAGTDLSGADLRSCRLQQACLDDAVLRDTNLDGAIFGELPAIRMSAGVNALALTSDGLRIFAACADGAVRHVDVSSGGPYCAARRCGCVD
jgi:hypothetical protein